MGAKGSSKQKYENFLVHNECDENQSDDCWIQKNDKIIFPILELSERIIYDLVLFREIGTYTWSLHISNLFDRDYKLIQDYPIPGRNWKFTLTKTIQIS